MARPKVREVYPEHVHWLRSGHWEPILGAEVTAKPSHWAASCWVCGGTVPKGEGLLVRVETARKPGADALTVPVHKGDGEDGCDAEALRRARILGETADRWRKHPKLCGARRGLRICTLAPGHDGAHAAQRRDGEAVDSWVAGLVVQTEEKREEKRERAEGAQVEGSNVAEAKATDGDANAALEALRKVLGVGSVDAETVRGIVREMVGESQGDAAKALAEAVEEAKKLREAMRPRLIVQRADGVEVELPPHTHEAADEALAVLTGPDRLLLLVGPTGTGKTHLARQLAEALGVRYFEQACYGASESMLLGYATATGGYVNTPTVDAVDYTREDGSKGALLCLDEFDACDESAAIALNSLLNGDGVATPRRAGMGHTHRGKAPLYIVATMNTDGTSYGTREYNARSKLDDATRDRLRRYRVWVDYDREVERAIVEATGLPMKVAEALWKIRERIAEHRLEGRHISTRAFRALGGLHQAHPKRWSAADLIARELADWTPEERAKVGH